jgi:hypothetical protein
LGIAPRHSRRECLLIRQHQPLDYHRLAALISMKPCCHGGSREV